MTKRQGFWCLILFLGVVLSAARPASAEQVLESWVARYDGPGHGGDRGQAIAIDGLGNVYVAGYSLGDGTGEDFATVKYDATGQEIWVARYNGSGNGSDEAVDIAVDGAQNVYVTGYSFESGSDYDCTTIKYDSNGGEVWIAHYNGAGNSADRAQALAIDASGNVYVTGHCDGGATNEDYATVKYSVDGGELWVAVYNTTQDLDDMGQAIALDSAGNVYVTGYSYRTTSNFDYATLKYDANGSQQWLSRYNGPGNGYDEPRAIALDGAGNVYVTGYSLGSGTSDDYATVKYNASGAEQWVARYNGPGNLYDQAAALGVDGEANVFVTGYSSGAAGDYDYATVKYDSAGSELWAARYNGPGYPYYDRAEALAIGPGGSVYVTGWSYGVASSYDYATLKYDSDGRQRWVVRYDGPPHGFDAAFALAAGPDGEVYVTGASPGSGTGDDYATVKYSPRPWVPSDDWGLELDASAGNYQDTTSMLGVDPLAHDGYDQGIDLPEPPNPPGPYVVLYFPHPEWGSVLGPRFNSDVRAPLVPGASKTWAFEVQTNIASSAVLLTWPRFALQTPESLRYVLVDIDGGGTEYGLDTTETFSFISGPGTTVRHFELRVSSLAETPDIELSPGYFAVTVASGFSRLRRLIISNVGTAPLTYSITDDATWLSESPTAGTVNPSRSDSIQVTFDATSLPPDTYSATITVSSNDPDEPEVLVPVTLVVLQQIDLVLIDPPTYGICGEYVSWQSLFINNGDSTVHFDYWYLIDSPGPTWLKRFGSYTVTARDSVLDTTRVLVKQNTVRGLYVLTGRVGALGPPQVVYDEETFSGVCLPQVDFAFVNPPATVPRGSVAHFPVQFVNNRSVGRTFDYWLDVYRGTVLVEQAYVGSYTIGVGQTIQDTTSLVIPPSTQVGPYRVAGRIGTIITPDTTVWDADSFNVRVVAERNAVSSGPQTERIAGSLGAVSFPTDRGQAADLEMRGGRSPALRTRLRDFPLSPA
jgi:uncharacterized delta-60 repeat protein